MKIDDSNREYSESEVRSYIKGLNARIANAEGVIDELKKENAELKAMLKLAIDDIKPLLENYTWLAECEMCAKDKKSCKGCYEPTWRYAEQALKLIGEENGI